MAGSKNNTHYSNGYNLYPVTAADIVTMQLKADGVQIINVDGPPNGAEAANPGSIACDRTNGNLWKKQSGTGNTGWEQIASGTDVATQYTTDSGIAVAVSNNINLLGQNLAGSGIQTTASGATVTHRMLSPYALGNFSFTGGDVSVSRSNSGGQVFLAVTNGSNTAGSVAKLAIQNGGAAGGDVVLTYAISGGSSWAMGMDLSVGASFVIAASSTLGTNNTISIAPTGGVSVLLGNLDVTRSATGVSVNAVIENTSDTASSDALIVAKVAGTSSGDAYHRFSLTGGQIWSQGLDNSDSDAFVIANTSVLGTGNVIRASTAGEINYPLQPTFLATITNTIADVTGDNTNYTVIFDNEIYDQGADFNLATSVFTAPVTGRYLFCASLFLQQLGVLFTDYRFNLVTSNRTYTFYRCSPSAIQTSGLLAQGSSAFADMDAGDTAQIDILVNGSTKTVDVLGSAGAANWFSGQLMA